MKDVYLTSTFTNPWNVEFGPRLGNGLEKAGLACYLPYRDTNQKGSGPEIFSEDLIGMDNARCILAIAVNESPNWGAEVGYAYKSGKPVIALTENEHTIPLICSGMLAEVIRVESLDAIDTYIGFLVEVLRKYL